MTIQSLPHSAVSACGRPAFRIPFLSLIAAWDVVFRQRKALVELDDRMLSDIGVTRDAALAEAQRPVWDVPCHWAKTWR